MSPASPNNIGNSAKEPRKKQVSAPAFLHDSNAHIDQKILRLRRAGGWEYYGLYWACIEIMRNGSDHRIEAGAVDALAFNLHVEEEHFRGFLDCCVSIGLFAVDESGYYSPALLNRIGRYNEVVEQKRAAGQASAAARSPKSVVTPVEHPLNTRSTSVEHTLNTPKVSVEHPQSNITKYNIIESNLIESNRTEPAPKNLGPWEAAVSEQLEPEESPKVQGSRVFITTGRRCMRKYPDVWLTPGEFVSVCELYERSGIPRKEFKRGFQAVAARIATQKAQGKDPEMVPAFNWLTSFVLNDVLDGLRKTEQLKQTEARSA